MSRKRPKSSSGIAVAYIRVSTDEQENGPEAQRAQLEAFARKKRLIITAWCSDIGVSGAAKIDERPGLMQALEAVRENRAGVLLVAKRDRLARDRMAALLIERLASEVSAKIVSADGVSDADTPEAMMLRGMLDLFAEYERACIRMRTKAALAAKRARGERVGQIPYGYQLGPDGRLEKFDDEQAVIALIKKLHVEMSVRDIADKLNCDGVPARAHSSGRPGRWHPSSVHRLLTAA